MSVSGDNPTEQGLKLDASKKMAKNPLLVSGDNPTEQGLKHRLDLLKGHPLPGLRG